MPDGAIALEIGDAQGHDVDATAGASGARQQDLGEARRQLARTRSTDGRQHSNHGLLASHHQGRG
ncbi:hypothetical protein [Streptomyces sp. NEAU-YJ-81]|uniref:hypothetical protein n=1 Tax=Streptomyces sp. NEAU-YJ-81 TaxID=2820288 RepID=UPI001ABC343E|nr:hypothetical protein [Streptomyces sp. NEAU-YJ-81]